VNIKARMLLVVNVWACSGETKSNPAEMPEALPTRASAHAGTVISSDDGTSFFGQEVAVDVRDIAQEPGLVAAVLAIGPGGHTWTAQFRAERSVLPAGEGVADIRQAPLDVGVANVERLHNGRPLHRAASGHVSYAFERDRVRMKVIADSELISGSIEAVYQVRCWVMPSALGLSGNGEVGEGSAVQLVLDEMYTSQFCAEFAPR